MHAHQHEVVEVGLEETLSSMQSKLDKAWQEKWGLEEQTQILISQLQSLEEDNVQVKGDVELS